MTQIEKAKPEIMHLMILSKCNYNCELCCNKLYDIDKIPVATVEELKTIHTLCITGGEPFMANINLDDFARSVKDGFPNIKTYSFIRAEQCSYTICRRSFLILMALVFLQKA